jgi:glycosyltransferase involved in cell wall biosynthesis
MRIAVVYPGEVPLAKCTIDLGLVVLGFSRLGHEAFAVCAAGCEEGFAHPVRVARNRAELGSQDFWQSHGIDLAVVLSWLGMPDVVTALKAAGALVLSKGDSDGYHGVRIYPWESFQRTVYPVSGAVMRFRKVLFWLKRYVYLYRAEDLQPLTSLEHADVATLETEAARRNFARFLDRYGRGDLVRKIHVIPNPVADAFLTQELPRSRRREIVAVGRWDDPQKDCPLLVEVLGRFLREDRSATVTVVGRDGERWLRPLMAGESRCRYLGAVAHHAMPALLAGARVMVFSSRWEGCPVAATEALASGCTIVGPPLPAFEGLTAAGEFGSLSRSRSASDLAAALGLEIRRWDDGERDAQAVAASWRARLAPTAVCAAMLDLVMSSRPARDERPVVADVGSRAVTGPAAVRGVNA